MTPYAPASSARMMTDGSFHGTRTSGTGPAASITGMSGRADSSVSAPCWRSISIQSNPVRANNSVFSVPSRETQPPRAGLPSLNSVFRGLGRRIGQPRAGG